MAEETAEKQQVELPGRAIVEYRAHYGYGPQSLELFGEPGDNGYTSSNIRWWHVAQNPLSSAPISKGDPCFAVTEGYKIIKYSGRGSLYANSYPTVESFQDLDDLDCCAFTPSIVCSMCGLHIWLSVDFLEKRNED